MKRRPAMGQRGAAWALACALGACALAPGARADSFSVSNATLEELLFHAQRYESTPEKRQRKMAAWQELLARGTNALRYAMGWVHVDNSAVPTLVLNLVEALPGEDAAGVLVDFLGAERWETRKMAAFFLGYHETPQYADRLFPLLADTNTCAVAIRCLGKWRVGAAVTNIVPYLLDPMERRRVVAANALRDLGDPTAAPALVAALGDPYFTVREAAARALIRLGPPGVPELIGALPGAPRPAQRYIVRILGVLRAAEAAPALRALWEGADPAARAEIQRALDALTAPAGGAP